MKQSVSMVVLSLSVGTLLVVDIMLFVALGIAHPVPWVVLAATIAIPFFSKRSEQKNIAAWRDEYSVGIESIDNDHKKLLDLINLVQASVNYHAGEDFERQALNELVDYTRFHFDREEAMLVKHGFPGSEEHKQKHAEMINEVEAFVAEYEKKGTDALEDVADYLRDWLINHINGTDQEYSAFIISKGEK